jgi:hypothetical protein
MAVQMLQCKPSSFVGQKLNAVSIPCFLRVETMVFYLLFSEQKLRTVVLFVLTEIWHVICNEMQI